ncbi:uncharacterized protein C10orf143 homolog isoform X1 [Ochotona princeps]|uniref:uncharacterized protein C10orf143 homolog isoform X1 n=1 Tax=Ochotona princeps TaxID=9978 RepID=UPI0027148E9D|nr:uncharacterized protein C10orf143 homolog isoform X1 [Ochotona princeps]
MDVLVPGCWRRRRQEEPPAPGSAKRTCRRLEAGVPERGYLQVGALRSPPDPVDAPAPAPAVGPPSGGRSCAQLCRRCIAGESGHLTHTQKP